MEKHHAIKSQIDSVIINQDQITDQDKINKQIFSFYQSLFSRKVQFQTDIIEAYLDNIPLPKLTDEQTLSCDGIISEDEVFKSLKSIDNNKSPGNDGLSMEFYECFWDEIKKPFLASIHKRFLEISYQAVMAIYLFLVLKLMTKILSQLNCITLTLKLNS